jgi:biopolymer transport protein ExbD
MNEDGGGLSGGHSGADAVPYINVTPLIDVLLVLLIIFMVISPLKPSRFKALIPEPPKNLPENVKPNPLNLRVEITTGSKLRLNGQDFGSVSETGALSSKLAQIFQEREANKITKFGTNEIEKTVFIAAPKETKYGDVAKVIDAVKGAGAQPVGLQVDALDTVGK